jgi:UDP-glucose 4-epimerase
MEITGKRLAIFGGAGFIGSHVANLAARESVKEVLICDKMIRKENIAPALATGKVRVMEVDVTQADQVNRLMEGVDGVFHLVALPITACEKMPRSCIEINVLGTFNVLEAAQSAGIQKIVFSSASSVYGNTDELMDEGHPLNARTLYGASKIAGEYFLRAFYDKYGLAYVVLRYMNVYGPNQEGGVIMSVLNRIRQGLPPVIYGDGSQSFDFIDVTDVARANLLAMQSGVTDETFNIGSGTEVTIKEIVSSLLEVTGINLEPVLEPAEGVLMHRRVGNSERAKQKLGFRPTVGLREGLRRVVTSLGMQAVA